MKGLSKFTKTYACFGGKSYITFSIPASEDLMEYQTEMLAKNKISSLLPLSVQRLNNDWKLSYDITSKIPLEKILERKSLNTEEFESIIKQIGMLSGILKDYLLDISSIIFDKSYIYCDPSDLSLYFVYFPVKADSFNINEMKNFIQRLIVEDIRLLNDSTGSLLKRLLDVLKYEAFNPEQLLMCLDAKPSKEQQEVYPSDIGDMELNGMNTQQNDAESFLRLTINREKDFLKPKANRHEDIIVRRKEIGNQEIQLKYPLKSYLVAGGVNIFFVGILIYVLLTKSFSKSLTSTLPGLILIGFAVNYFILTRLFPEEKKTNEHTGVSTVKRPVVKQFVNDAIEEDIILPKRTPLKSDTWSNINLVQEPDSEGIENLQLKSECVNQNYQHATDNYIKNDLNSKTENVKETRAILYQEKHIQDKTVILGFASESGAYLQSHSCPTEKIKINRASMLLGRLTDSVDYTIQNKAVGKIHAEIVKREDNYFIIDLNSVNGTYVNNERITCNTEVRLKNGDIVTLANEAYTFVV